MPKHGSHNVLPVSAMKCLHWQRVWVSTTNGSPAPAKRRERFSGSYLRQKVVIRICTPTIHALASVATKRK